MGGAEQCKRLPADVQVKEYWVIVVGIACSLPCPPGHRRRKRHDTSQLGCSPAHPLGLDKLLFLDLLHPLRHGTGGARHSEDIFDIHGPRANGSASAVGSLPPPIAGKSSTALLPLEHPLNVCCSLRTFFWRISPAFGVSEVKVP